MRVRVRACVHVRVRACVCVFTCKCTCIVCGGVMHVTRLYQGVWWKIRGEEEEGREGGWEEWKGGEGGSSRSASDKYTGIIEKNQKSKRKRIPSFN